MSSNPSWSFVMGLGKALGDVLSSQCMTLAKSISHCADRPAPLDVEVSSKIWQVWQSTIHRREASSTTNLRLASAQKPSCLSRTRLK
eukprot:4826491-Amphidinium_carterae.2